MRSADLSPASQSDIRSAALGFTHAVSRDNPEQARALTLVSDSPASQEIETAVLNDTLTSHVLQSTLVKKFSYHEENAAVIGSDAWVDRYEVARSAPIQRAGDRAHIGIAGKEGGFFLHNVSGQWKVELIATFVSEARGLPNSSDPAVLYRFGVNQAVNQWLLARIDHNDFSSVDDYDKAHDIFWIKYLGCTLSGKDPHAELLASLPPLPPQDQFADNE